jgi:plasmid stabilization system protein ParE
MAALRWSDAALDDLYAIRQSLTADAAKRIGRILVDSTDCLTDFPERGRPGALEGTRELPLPGLPWRVIYALGGDGWITILRVAR